MTIIILGDTASKKNSKRLVLAGGRPRLIPSKAYVAWHEQALWQLKKVKPYKGKYPIMVTIDLYPGTRRRQDLSNRAESVMDTLVDAGIIEDDDMEHVSTLLVRYVMYDKKDPRAIVDINRKAAP